MSKLQFKINTRQRSIIHAILESESHITLKDLAEKTQLSVRVIRYNMESILAWFHNEGIHTEVRPGYGFYFDLEPAKRKLLLDSLLKETDQPITLTRSQRQRMALLELLVSEKPLSFQYLASNEGISRSTVVTDIADMQERLGRYHLKLVKTPNKGTYIRGSEFFRRCALINIIREELGLVKYYSLWLHSDKKLLLDHSLPDPLETFLQQLDFENIVPYIGYIEKIMGLNLSIYSRVEVMLYLSITFFFLRERQRTGERSSFYMDLELEVDEGQESEISRFIMNKLRHEFKIELSPVEYQYTAVTLLFAKWDNEEELINGVDEYSGEHSYNISHDALFCADMITAACANQLHPMLQTDEELVMNLARHFHTVFNQIRYDYPIINENLEMVLKEYPEIFHCVNNEVSIIEDQIQKKVPVEEIGYIVMYMVAALNKLQTRKAFRIPVIILSDGIRTKSIFLKDRLQLIFPTLQVITLVNGYPEDEKILEKADLVLSLIPGIFLKRPVIEVSPMLTQSEINRIQEWIFDYEANSRNRLMMTVKKPDLVDLLKPEHILLGTEASDWQTVIRLASLPLEAENLIKTEFCDAMIHITGELGPYTLLAPGVALLNARPNDGVNKLCMSLILLKKPVDFGASCEIDIAFVLGASDNHSHLNALYQLSQICRQEAFIRILRGCTSPSEVLRAVWSYSADYNLSELI